MKIGLDLDSVILDLGAMYMNIANSWGITDYPADWGFSNYSKELRLTIYDSFKIPYLMNNLDPFEGVKSALKLWKKYYELVIITCRCEAVKEGTLAQTKKLFNIPTIVVTDQDKSEIFKQEAIDIWIDDYPENLKIAGDMGIIPILVSNETTPYNHYARKDYDWIERLSDIDFRDLETYKFQRIKVDGII